MSVVLVIDVIDEIQTEVPIEERFFVETLAFMLMNFDGYDLKEYDKTVYALTRIG